MLPVEVEHPSKALYAKSWPKNDSFSNVRPDAADSVSGWYIFNQQD